LSVFSQLAILFLRGVLVLVMTKPNILTFDIQQFHLRKNSTSNDGRIKFEKVDTFEIRQLTADLLPVVTDSTCLNLERLYYYILYFISFNFPKNSSQQPKLLEELAKFEVRQRDRLL
jgi:hypothetical protein